MATVKLLSLAESPEYDDWARGALTVLRESARTDRFGAHTLTDDPGSADIILFAELRGDLAGVDLQGIRRHPIYRAHRDKVFVYGSMDYVVARVPGIYASIERQFYDRTRTRTGPYLSVMPNPFVEFRPIPNDAPYLFSFKGTLYTHPVRSRIHAALGAHPRGIIEDVGRESTRITTAGTQEERMGFWQGYAEQMAQSKFVLCPRGRGPNTIRLYECLKMGRVPVIVSDGWVPLDGPDWEKISVRVLESDIERIPEILAAIESKADAMGREARENWEAYLAPDTLFHHFTEWCLDMQRTRRLPEPLASALCAPQVLRKDNLRLLVREWRRG